MIDVEKGEKTIAGSTYFIISGCVGRCQIEELGSVLSSVFALDLSPRGSYHSKFTSFHAKIAFRDWRIAVRERANLPEIRTAEVQPDGSPP